MTFVPPKPGGWNLEDKLTSAQVTALQAAITAADAAVHARIDGAVARLDAAPELAALGAWRMSGVALGTADRFTLAQVVNRGGFSVASNVVTFPSAGTYLVSASALMTNADTANPKPIGFTILDLDVSSTVIQRTAVQTRVSADASLLVSVSAQMITVITNPSLDAQRLMVRPFSAGGTTIGSGTLQHSALTIQRIA